MPTSKGSSGCKSRRLFNREAKYARLDEADIDALLPNAATYVTTYTTSGKECDMAASTTMTIRVTPDLKEKLGRLAHNTRRTKSYLAAEAVEAYVNRELQIIEGIERGLADREAGRVTPHDAAMDRIDAAIAAADKNAA